MPKPRKQQIAIDATPFYHCTSRCVRRAFLCGTDHYSGKSYEHRRVWVEDRIHELPEAFCIEVCAYAVMSNHIHVALHINKDKALALSPREVCERWLKLFKAPPLIQQFFQGEALSLAERDVVDKIIALWRERLYSISWFMRCLNEPIARQANAEDKCTGSFWEGRFNCQALLDDKALAACLAYVDLNPIRANMADTPETSDYTSVKTRIETFKEQGDQPNTLYPFVGNPRQDMPEGLAFHLQDYLELVDWTGRIIRDDKKGTISSELPPILQRLNFSTASWIKLTTKFESKVSMLVGDQASIETHAEAFGYQRLPRLTARVALSESG